LSWAYEKQMAEPALVVSSIQVSGTGTSILSALKVGDGDKYRAD